MGIKEIKYGGRQVTLGIRNPCNYNCFYCVGAGYRQTLEQFDLEQIELNYKQIKDFTLTAFECGTGEPTLHPQIRGLLELCLRYGPVVSFPTNLSLHPRHWLPDHNLKMMTVLAALHPDNEVNITRFLEHLLYLKELDVSVMVSFVCHPKRYHKKELYKDFFNRFQIPISLVPYSGVYNSIEYPAGYSLIQRGELGLKKHENWNMDLSYEATWRNFRTIPCLAGYIDVFMNPQGQIFRCLYDLKPIKIIYDKAKPCRVGYCGCGFLLEELNTRGPDYWNPWRKKAGIEVLNESRTDYKIVLKKKKKVYQKLRNKYEDRHKYLRPRSLGEIEGISEALKNLFSDNGLIDFIGIGLFFNSLSENINFKKELIGNLFDNAIDKQGKEVLGKTILSIRGFPKSKLSKKVLLSVQHPDNIWNVDYNWMKNESIEVYCMVADAAKKYKLTRII